MRPPDPYDILGASPIDSPETIKAKYRSCILKYHPDKSTGDLEKYKMVVWAYHNITRGSTALYEQEDDAKKQSAKYSRKDPSRKGRAARKKSRQSARPEPQQNIQCAQCGGSGYVERRVGMLRRHLERVACDGCRGTGSIHPSQTD